MQEGGTVTHPQCAAQPPTLRHSHHAQPGSPTLSHPQTPHRAQPCSWQNLLAGILQPAQASARHVGITGCLSPGGARAALAQLSFL